MRGSRSFLLPVIAAAVLVPATTTAAQAGSVAPRSAAKTVKVPNPCLVLAKVHPEKSIAKGKKVHARLGKLQSFNGGFDRECTDVVGTIHVTLDLSQAIGGFGGVDITSTTHPSGLGSGDSLFVGKALGTGKPVDFVVFHRGCVFASLSANGAKPAALTTLARQVYKAIP